MMLYDFTDGFGIKSKKEKNKKYKWRTLFFFLLDLEVL